VNWAERNRPLLEKARTYLSDFAIKKPGMLECFQDGARPLFPLAPESDRGTALLLIFCSLRQNISEDRLIRFLSYLWKEYGLDIFRLNHVPFSDLQSRVNRLTDMSQWPLWPKAPGILRSVCDFFFRHGRLGDWVRNVGDGEECVRILAEEIFLMGKTSDFRPKPRLFLWLMTQLPHAEPSRFWSDETLVYPTPGHSRFLREFGPLKGKRIPWTTPAEKLSYHNRFYRLLFPGKTYTVFSGLDAFLKPDPETKWECRKILGGCENCILVGDCPGSEI
jgi:hypothetical protein